MTLLRDEFLNLLVRSLRATLPQAFTGKVTIVLNFHAGDASSVVVGFEEGKKLTQ